MFLQKETTEKNKAYDEVRCIGKYNTPRTYWSKVEQRKTTHNPLKGPAKMDGRKGWRKEGKIRTSAKSDNGQRIVNSHNHHFPKWIWHIRNVAGHFRPTNTNINLKIINLITRAIIFLKIYEESIWQHSYFCICL